MTNILIQDLSVPGITLFEDPESYITELTNDEFKLSQIQGGLTPLSIVTYATYAVAGGVLGYEVSQAISVLFDA